MRVLRDLWGRRKLREVVLFWWPRFCTIFCSDYIIPIYEDIYENGTSIEDEYRNNNKRVFEADWYRKWAKFIIPDMKCLFEFIYGLAKMAHMINLIVVNKTMWLYNLNFLLQTILEYIIFNCPLVWPSIK